jgi:hypothetical protein
MVVYLGEPVQVGAVFKKGEVIPRWFLYRGRKVLVKGVTFSWKEREGQSLFYHFSVSDGVNLYDLAFQAENLSWQLESIEDQIS